MDTIHEQPWQTKGQLSHTQPSMTIALSSYHEFLQNGVRIKHHKEWHCWAENIVVGPGLWSQIGVLVLVPKAYYMFLDSKASYMIVFHGCLWLLSFFFLCICVHTHLFSNLLKRESKRKGDMRYNTKLHCGFQWTQLSCGRIRYMRFESGLKQKINWCFDLIIKNNHYKANIIDWNFTISIKK